MMILGRTAISVHHQGFGALPMQRVSTEAAVTLVRTAIAGGMNFFDTARGYTDSETKLGLAIGSDRSRLTIATKTPARDGDALRRDLAASLRELQTDYIDIYQFHNPPFCPRPGDGTGLYEAALEALEAGQIRHIGITNHRLKIAREAVESGLYETLQFPFSYLADEQDMELMRLCAEHNVGLIAMKALSGGLITHARAAAAWIGQFPHVLPIWGIQKPEELEQFLALGSERPELTPELQAIIDRDRRELIGEFCRSCGYCLPCPQNIDIPTAARMMLLLGRMPTAQFLTPEAQGKMARIHTCIHCNQCSSRCPYSLDTPALLTRNLRDYEAYVAEHC